MMTTHSWSVAQMMERKPASSCLVCRRRQFVVITTVLSLLVVSLCFGLVVTIMFTLQAGNHCDLVAWVLQVHENLVL